MARFSFPPSRLRTPAQPRQVAAYTLVELLVGVALGSIVLGALGGALLVSEMKVSGKIRSDLDNKDALNRAVALMRQEISSAGKISLNANLPPTAANQLCVSGGLYLYRAPSTVICYKPVVISSTLISATSAYGTSTDRPWSGSCVLMRQGPPYKSNGELDTTSTAIRQVVLDNLVACSPTSAALAMSVTNSGSVATNSTIRDVDITLNQANGVSTSFSARIASNPIYAGIDMYSSCSGSVGSTSSTLCYGGTNAMHFMPAMNTTGATATTMAGQADKENVFYFQYARSAYTLQQSATSTQPCTYSSCFVLRNGTPASVQLSNADVLVFADGELRP